MARILILDDEPVPCRFLSRFLSGHGYQVETAIRAQEAIELAAEFRPDLLLVDWLLKDECNGLDVARTLRARNPELCLVFITGLPTEKIEVQAESLRPCTVLGKPTDLDVLLATIQISLAASETRQAGSCNQPQSHHT